jgi:SRSO17 transposase
VPDEVEFQESWRIALDLLDRSRQDVPFTWVAGDDEYGRPSEFRGGLRQRKLWYVLDVPCNTSVRPVGIGAQTWSSVEALAKAQPSSSWRKIKLGPGSKGLKVVRALKIRVQTRDNEGRPGTVEDLVVIRTVSGEPRTWYTLARGPEGTTLEKFVQVHARRHGIEEMLQRGKGEVGLADYEVRSWMGWHHHMTLSLLALWFLTRETERAGGENASTHFAADARVVRSLAHVAAGDIERNRGGDQHGPTTQRRVSDLRLVCGA